MNALDALAACSGDWVGTSTLQDPHAGIAEESPSTLAITPVRDGVRLDYTWSYRGERRRGSVHFVAKDGAVVAPWTDTWHTGGKPMSCSGPLGDTISVRVVSPLPRGRTGGGGSTSFSTARTCRRDVERLADGQEEMAVEAVYTRA